MGKKRSWFSLVKRIFISEAKEKEEKKPKSWRCLFTRFKLKQCPTLAAPRRTLTEARAEQRKHALTVALATAAAAEAAVAAARAAAEVVRLTCSPPSYYHTCDKRNQNLAAIKIQTAFRGYLARKALQALKGLVRLQALVRGQIVRRQAITKLKCLPSTANTRAQVNIGGVLTTEETYKDGNNRKFLRPKKECGGREIKAYVIEQLEGSGQRSWDYNILSQEDVETIWLRKQEALIRRERMKKYSSSHRERINAQMPEETEPYKENGRQSCQLVRWMDSMEHKRKEAENSKAAADSNLLNGHINGTTNIELRNGWKQNSTEGSDMPFSLPRRSFCHRKHNSVIDDSSFPSSPVFPTYMAATESAKAKARALSTPKQRLGFLDSCFDQSSPYTNRPSFWSSLNGESISSSGRSGYSWQNTVSMKSLN
ncbi:hypothetical protein VitviT2T_012790 [Vitis vinifera]|uniref:DUF4005 domain-containing protein n=2 Tax=Vitis vinifera TaxID=29760 RepID=A0ABY9CES9_VITVI